VRRMYRIERCLAEQTMKYEDEVLEVSENRLELTALEGEVLDGTISVRSRSGCELHMFFYSNHYRMQCRIPDFIGKEGELVYRFDTTGLEVGNTEKGELCILSEAGEYHIPFTVSIRRPLAETSLGEIRNLFHFANLAREHWEEAVRLFYTKDFSMLFYGHDRKYYDLYRGLSVHEDNQHNVDEFLVGISKKSKNTYSVREEGLLLKDVTDGQQEYVTLVCSGWGYMYADVTAKGEFLVPVQTSVSNVDFDGEECQVAFRIDASWLKPGSNIGALVFEYEGGIHEIPVIVEMSSKVSRKAESLKESRKLMAQLMRDYIAYATSDSNASHSLKAAEKTIEQINAGYGRNLFGRLCQMHILLEMGRESEARWVLSHIEKTQQQADMEPVQYGYYLYVRSLLESQEAFARSAKEQICRLYEKYPNEMFLACLYVRMCGEKLSPQERLAIYRQQYEFGSRNPILYLETFSIYKESLAYLSEADAFEVSVLRFGLRYGLYTESMAQRVTEIVVRKKEMSPALFAFLSLCYEEYPSDEMLHAICTLMVRSGMCSAESFPWYARAVEKQLRITSLYEYYMMSADTRVDRLPPRAVLMYFAYHCELDERRKAYLFSLLVRHRGEIPELFRQYESKIKEFAFGQMEKGIISENLAVLYRYLLGCDEQKIPQDKIQKIAFRHLIKVKSAKAVNVVVLQENLSKEAVYPIEKQRAYVDCYTSDYVVLLEDAHGNRFCDSRKWTDTKLMAVEKLAMYFEEQDEDGIGFLMYRAYIGGTPEQAGEQFWPIYEKLVLSDEVDDVYRHEIGSKLLKLYFDNEQYDKIELLLQKYDMRSATAGERADVVRYLVYMEKDKKALEILFDYGFENVSAKSLTRLIGRCLESEKGFDDKLMALVSYTFRLGKYTQEMLTYLCRYFEGTLKQMRDVWKASVSFDVDASAVAERILQAYLFSHGYLSEIAEVFAYYAGHNKRESVVKAYISDLTYRYFVKQQLPQEYVFRVLEQMLSGGYEMDRVSRVAYLYYMATEKDSYTEPQMALITQMVNDMITQAQYVPFFTKFVDFIPWLTPYAELTYLEYRTAPGRDVTLHYLKEGQSEQYFRVKLAEVCAGYYCHNFVLFFGERLQYYFMEQQGSEKMLTESGCLEKSDMTGEEAETRYGLLNDIIMSEKLGDERTKRELIHRYETASILTEKLFGEH